ncbi:hypothetical protein KA977_05580 [Candidatus Dependentiae bacterium]|nr:hypothetical protein [Candidatus Dependentiae bacterium]
MKKKFIFGLLFVLLSLIQLKNGECIPYNIRINNSIRNVISAVNPVITWSSADTYSHINIQISNTSDFSSNYIDSSIAYSLNFIEIKTVLNDTYYVRIRTSQNSLNYTDWSDTDNTDYFILNLKFTDLIINTDTFTHKSRITLTWLLEKPDLQVFQTKYAIYSKKNYSADWTDSTGEIVSIDYAGLIIFPDSGIYNIKLILTDNFGNKTECIPNLTVIYDTADFTIPQLINISYTTPLSYTDTIFQITSMVYDSSLLNNAELILSSNENELHKTSITPLNNAFFSKTITGLNLLPYQFLYVSIKFSDEYENSLLISDSIQIHNFIYDFIGPQITTYPEITDAIIQNPNYELTVISQDSSAVKSMILWINGIQTLDTSSSACILSFTESDTGIIKIKVQSSDYYNNISEAVFYLKKNTSANADSEIVPYLTNHSWLEELQNRNGILYSIPSSIKLYFNSKVSTDSPAVYLYDEDGFIKLNPVQLSDTSLECVLTGIPITSCENYYIKISGTDYNNINFNNEDNKIYFKLMGSSSLPVVINKSSVVMEIPPNTFSEPYWINIEKLNYSSSDIQTAYQSDSSVSYLRTSSENILKIDVYSNLSVKLNSLNMPVKLGLKYSDSDNNGIIDGSNNLNEQKLYISYLDPVSNRFVKPENIQYIDYDSNIAYITLSHFSIWALSYNSAGNSLAESVKIYPSGRYAVISEIQFLTIMLHSSGGIYDFKIFSKNGSKIKQWSQNLPAGNLTDTVKYDLTDLNGKKIRTGTYFLMVKSNLTGEEIIKPFIVVE